MSWHGNRTLEQTFHWTFNTVDSDGVPTTLTGTPSLSAYENLSTTQITAGLTLTVDLDGVTGFHGVTVVATTANGYEAAKDYDVIIAAGTVDGVSVVGYNVGSFSIQNCYEEAFASLGTYDVPTKTEMDNALASLQTHGDDEWGGVDPLYSGTAVSATSTTVVLASDAASVDSYYVGTALRTLTGTGANQDRLISAYVGSTRTATVTDAWVTNPDSSTTLRIDPARVHVDNVSELQSGIATAAALTTLADRVLLLMAGLGITRLERVGDDLTGYAEDLTTPIATWELDSTSSPTARVRTS
jgi:hypothetical protein